eukprot:scaffold92309_cov43-Attheya_sp.AAC.1
MHWMQAGDFGIDQINGITYIAPLLPCDGTNPVRYAIQQLEAFGKRVDGTIDYSRVSFHSNYYVLKRSRFNFFTSSARDQHWWKPGQCPCGYERGLVDSSCNKVDACFYQSDACPEKSVCSETKTYCQCDPGYRNSDDGTDHVDSSTLDTCVTPLEADQRITGESFQMSITMPDDGATEFTLGCTRTDEANTDQPPVTTIHHGQIVPAIEICEAGICSFNFDKLRPGRLYHGSIVPGNLDEASLRRHLSEHFNLKYTTDAVTVCCCNCPTDPTDISGRPTDFKTHQHNGDVLFSFKDNSRCAEAYAFSRSEVIEEFREDESLKAVFAPNYYYFPKSKCSNSLISPGQGAKDDLRISELKVGTGYNYCVRAVSEHYSDHRSEVKGETVFSSEETCGIHVVRWQASISGKITTAPQSGSLPIESVIVSWTLYSSNQVDVIAQGRQVTEESGLFMAHFDELSIYLENEKEYPVLFQFSKLTETFNSTIIHRFLCNEGTVNCTDTGTIAYLKHLEFEKPLHVYDTTSVPFKGKILIEGTDSEASGDGCLINGATVCLIDKSITGSDAEGICVDTDSNGEYEAPAIIGSTVSVEVNYRNHTFLPFYGNIIDYDKGITIDPAGRYERNDFMDMTKAHLFVEVAGGLCNHTLGISTIKVKVRQCNWFQEFTQDSFKAAYLVPGSQLDVSVMNVVKPGTEPPEIHGNIMAVFDKMTKMIDLRDTSGEDEDIEEAENAEGNSDIANALGQLNRAKEVVRFQFAGTLTLDFQFGEADNKGNCNIDDLEEDAGQGTSSLHVIPVQSAFSPIVFLKYQLVEDLFCDIVSDDMTGKGPSFALPTYKPILVLRDPPGGLSTASYQNVQTTIKVTSSSRESYKGFNAGIKLGFGGDQTVQLCSGGGFGAILLGCYATIKTKASVKTTGEKAYNFYDHRDKDTNTGKFTTTW